MNYPDNFNVPPKQNSRKRPLLKSEIETAQRMVETHKAAARYLNTSYDTYKKYAKMYDMWDNYGGVANPGKKFYVGKSTTGGRYSLDKILSGELPYYNKQRLKFRILKAGILPAECVLCGYKHTRPNGDPPLVLYTKDGNSTNLKLDNLELRCYNCIYITTGYTVPLYERAEESPSKPGVATMREDTKEFIDDDEISSLMNEMIESQGEDIPTI